jgi:ubiquinone/menaquinone biosynthesis C-methylase UbiE
MNTRNARRLIACTFLLLVASAAEAGRDDWQQPDRVMRDLHLQSGASVADVGCGRGYFLYRIAGAVGPEGTVYAQDINDKILKGVEDRLRKEKRKNIRVVKGDASGTKLPDACADTALLVNVLHHVPKEGQAGLVRDIARAIKPGGRFFLIDWRVKAKIGHDKDKRIPREQLVKMAGDAGLALDAEFHYLVHQVFLRFRKPAAKAVRKRTAASDQ